MQRDTSRESLSPSDSVGQQCGELDRIADILDTDECMLNSVQVVSLLKLLPPALTDRFVSIAKASGGCFSGLGGVRVTPDTR